MSSHATTPAPFRIGQQREMKGYVTQLREVTEQDPDELASRLGFAPRLMADGYALLLLLGKVARQDFAWRDTTRFSGGWVKERVYFKENNRLAWADEYVQRADQDRFRFHQGDGYRHERSWDAFLADQLVLLNVRKGSERIVKLVPMLRGGAGDYPDARRTSALQWELMVDKQFVCVALVQPGGLIRKGEFEASYLT